MINDYDKNTRPHPQSDTTRRVHPTGPDGKPVTTVPPRRYRPGIPLLIAAFVLIAAITGLVLGTPRPTTTDSIMPTASAVQDNDLAEPGIEPAAPGDQDMNGIPTTGPAGVAGTTTADTNSMMTDQSGNAATGATTAYRTEDECVDANDGTSCYMQSCARTDQIACPAGLTEAWRPSTVMNNNTGNNADTGTMTGNTDTMGTNGNTNNAIPPAANPSAPRNDGTIGTDQNTNQNSTTGGTTTP